MSGCSFCDDDSDDVHPVSFRNHPDFETPEEIKPYIGLGDFLDDTEASEAAEEFWENCAHVCEKCFRKYWNWIAWWG